MNSISSPLSASHRTSAHKRSILIVGTASESTASLTAIVQRFGMFAVEQASRNDFGKSGLRHAPDMLLLNVANVTSEELDSIADIRANLGDVPIVVVSELLDDADVRKLLKLKVHDWLKKPVVPDELLASIDSGIRVAKQNSNRVHAVVSAVGGAGATTLAVNLSEILAQRKGGDASGGVGLFDLDFSTGSCGSYLNMANGFAIDTIAVNPGRIDSEFVSLIQQWHKRGFSVYSFKRPELVTHLNCYELVLRLLDAVTMQHSHTVLDIPYYETDWRSDVLSAVNTVTLVTELNLPSIKHTLDILQTMSPEVIGKKPVTVVINKDIKGLFSRRRIDTSKLTELFRGTPFLFMPLDTGGTSEALDRGVLLSDISSSSKLLKALTKYAKSNLLAVAAEVT